MKNYCLLFAIFFIAVTSHAQLFLNEDFDYEPDSGVLTSDSGGVWNSLNSGSPAVGYIDPGLTMLNYPASSATGAASITNTNGEIVNSSFVAANPGKIFYSALVNLSSVGIGDSGFFMNLRNSSNEARARVFARDNGAGGINFGIISQGSNAQIAWTTSSYSLNTTYLIVASYDTDIDSGLSELFVLTEPTLNDELTPDAQHASVAVSGFDSVVIRQHVNGPVGTVDGIRVASEWVNLMIDIALADGPPSGSSIVVPAEAASNATIDFTTTSFTMSGDAGGGISDGTGMGYIKWEVKDTSDDSFVDGGNIFTSNNSLITYPINNLTTGKTYALTARLVDNDGNLFPDLDFVYTLTFTIEEMDILGVIGSATENGWGGPNIDLNYDETSQIWTGDITLIDGEIKFRVGNSWEEDYGDNSPTDGILDLHGENIPVAAGDYFVKVDLNTNTYSLESQYVSIPDNNFETYLETHNADGEEVLLGDPTSMGDGTINNLTLKSKVEVVSILNVTGKNISDLTGIEAFVNIKELVCSFNRELTSLDLSNNTQLETFSSRGTSLSELDVTSNTLLVSLDVLRNNLGSIDVSKNVLLKTLVLSRNNISELDVSKNLVLESLACSSNKLTNIDVSNNTSLKVFALNGRFNTEYTLSEIDLSKNVALEVLILGYNQLAEVDVSNNRSLVFMSVKGNQLTSLDVSNNNALTSLNCSENQLTSLDISKNVNLQGLFCNHNQLVGLDVSKNPSLNRLIVNDNSLVYLNMRNGNNKNIIPLSNPNIIVFDVSKNPDLTCITADGVAAPDISQVMIDSGAPFSEDCFLVSLDASTNITCNDANDGTINITASEGLEPYVFSWTKDANTTVYSTDEDLTNLAPGIYHLTVTDATESAKMLDVEIIEPDALVATIVNNSTVCSNNAEVTVSVGTADYTYLWSNGATTASINNVPVGTYDVTVTDANLCTVTASIELTVGEAFNPSASVTDVTCFGAEDGIITVTNANGTAPFTFSKDGITFSAPQLTFPYVFTDLAAGTYEIAVRDVNGCTGFITKTVSQPEELSATLIAVESTCYNQSTGSISVEVTGGAGGLSYNWTGDGDYTSSQKNISGLAAGNYELTVTDNNECIAMLDVIVPAFDEIVVNATVMDVLCKGEFSGSIDLTVSGGSGSGFTYLWNNGENSNSITNIGPGNYSVTITDLGFGCTVIGEYAITQPTNNLNLSTTKTNATGCYSLGIITAIGSGGTEPYEYKLNDSHYQDNGEFVGLFAGTYTVEVKDENGCISMSEVIITDSGKDEWESNNSKRKAKGINVGETISARISDTRDEDWFSIIPDSDGDYIVNLNHPSASFNVALFPDIRNASALVGTGPLSNQYDLTGGETYFVQITGGLSFVCYDLSVMPLGTASKEAKSKKTNSSTIAERTVKFWPNPSSTNFNIKVISNSNYEKVDIQVFDINNRLVHKGQFHSNQDYQFGQNLEGGIYIINLKQADQLEVLRLVKY